jgi:trimethylamine:corrinoid methyltransferase-like protein
MSRDNNATLENARDVAAIVNAMLAAKAHDPRRFAVGLLAVAQVLVGDDAIGRVTLATLMCEAAAELLSGVALEQLLDLETVDVRRWWN